jgi:hypothetical protein
MARLSLWLLTVLFFAPLFPAFATEPAKKPAATVAPTLPAAASLPARSELRRVYTNDDIVPAVPPAEEVTLAAEPAPAAVVSEAAEAQPPGVALTRIRRRAETALEQGLETLQLRERQLDILERESVLQITQYFSDPNFPARERTGDFGGLDQLSRQIEQQRLAVAGLTNSLAPLADLVEDLRWEAASEIAREDAARRQTQEYWQGRLAPLRAELAALDAEIANFRSQMETGRTGIVIGMGNRFIDTYDYVNQLERKRESLRRATDAIEDEARQQAIPPGWLR